MKNKHFIFIICVLLLFLIIAFSVFFNKKNINQNYDVHLLFNTDRNYKEFTKIAIKSAIVNKKPESIYHINVLCVEMQREECNEFKSLESENAEIKITMKNFSDISNIKNYEISHYVTRTDLFKFIFSEIFDESKILYIDSDTLILGDLRDLYNTDISQKFLAAVLKMEPESYYPKRYYFNCGVMLFNLDKFRELGMPEILISAKNHDMQRDYQTQRVFNEFIPLSKIKKLSPVYNDIDRWNDEYKKKYNYLKTYFPYSLRYPTIKELDKHAVIIHYAGAQKPWIKNTEAEKYVKEYIEYAKMVNSKFQPLNIDYESKKGKI